MKYLPLIIFILFSLSCSSQDCSKLPLHFTSYESALRQVKNSSFRISEKVNTNNSSWIEAASYYSCDGVTGYFIYKAKGKEYIHAGVPLHMWNGFKAASSKGGIYNQQIKDKYKLNL